MPLYYITGIAGTGKSTIKTELAHRGYTAYDGDLDGINSWQNKQTGEQTHRPPDGAHSKEWLELNDWNMSLLRLKELALEARNQPVFICGTAGNRHELWYMFDKVICLTIDETTLKHRLATRTGNQFGKTEQELTSILGWHKPSEKDDKKAGAIMVDCTRPLKEVVDEIIEILDIPS